MRPNDCNARIDRLREGSLSLSLLSDMGYFLDTSWIGSILDGVCLNERTPEASAKKTEKGKGKVATRDEKAKAKASTKKTKKKKAKAKASTKKTKKKKKEIIEEKKDIIEEEEKKDKHRWKKADLSLLTPEEKFKRERSLKKKRAHSDAYHSVFKKAIAEGINTVDLYYMHWKSLGCLRGVLFCLLLRGRPLMS